MPKISVIMPAYNAEKYIGLAIESIIDQTFTDWELIIVDDGSMDGTWQIINNYAQNDPRIIPLKNEVNLKLAKSLNKGIEVARGKYIARMDADDWSYPQRLMSQFNFMEEHEDVGIVGAAMHICSPSMEILSERHYPLNDFDIRKNIFYYNPFCHPVVLIRKDILNKCGLYNPAYNLVDDYELYFRIGEYSKFANLSEILHKYRLNDTSMTSTGTKKMELMTIKTRYDYAKKYNMSLKASVFTLIQYLTIYIIPSAFRVKIFTFLRDKKVENSK